MARVQLHPMAERALDRLEREQLAEGMKASRTELVSAVVCGITTPQAVGMVRRFVMDRYAEEYPDD